MILLKYNKAMKHQENSKIKWTIYNSTSIFKSLGLCVVCRWRNREVY